MKWTQRFKRSTKPVETNTTVIDQIQEETQFEIDDDTKSTTSDLVAIPRQPWPQRNGSFPVLPSRRLSTDTTSTTRSDELQPAGGPEVRRLGRTSTWGLSSHRRDTSVDRRYDPLGLTVLYTPPVEPVADIIFVHGLGGSSKQTWSKDRNPLQFWPKEWLPSESDVADARISTFGYNSQFNAASGAGSMSNTSDFARDLLFSLKYSQDGIDASLEMGKVPIIFVVHSMGGIVFKRAYIQGHDNPVYSAIVKQIRAVLFLSTPHRGTDLARVLNRILSASIGNTPREYITELQRNSSTIEDINEQFRHFAANLKIFSFYETLRTQVGPKSMMVLQRDSSTLGYPGEICDPLDADHHDVCKFSSREDPSYKSILSALKSVISDLRSSGEKLSQEHLKEDVVKISSLLSVSGAPEDDYLALIDQWVPGTSCNVLSSPVFHRWSSLQSEKSEILWVHGRPGSGKSMITASVVNHMSDSQTICSYFFFKFSDTTKQSCSSLLRSIAYQTATEAPQFRASLVKFAEDGLDMKKFSYRMIWEKVFISLLFTLELDRPMTWIIDALDESVDVNNILALLSTVHLAKTPIKVFCTNRKTVETTTLQRITKVPISIISADDNSKDIALYADTEMAYMHGTDEFREEIVQKIVQKSEGSFLWVHLAIKDIMRCHQEDDVREALDDFPGGMAPLYERMEKSISQLSRPSDKAIAKGVLSWVAYSRVPLDIDMLTSALSSDLRSIIDFKHTVTELCGGFVVVDTKNRVTLVHQTARAYLLQEAQLPFDFSPHTIHEDLFTKTLAIYVQPQIPVQSRQKPLAPFHEYAATSWGYHLQRSSSASDKCLDLLVKFLKGRWIIHWIYAICSCDHLDVIISASSVLTTFVDKRRRYDSDKSPLMHRLIDLELIEVWALDLMKIVGKFGGNLLQRPECVSKILPQLCPTNSVLHRQFGDKTQFSVRGLSNTHWDDSLARILVGTQGEAYAVTSSSLYIAVADDQGSISLWNSLTFTHYKTFIHGQRVIKICFNSSGTMLASCGFSSSIIWDVQTGRQSHVVANSKHSHILSLTFAEGDTSLLAGLDPAKSARFVLEETEKGWQDFGPSLTQEDLPEQGAFANSPNMVAFDKNVENVAVCYRRFPLTVWTLSDPELVRRCYRTACRPDMVSSSASWSGVTCLCWHPVVGDILGVYDDGVIFRWNPFSELYQELRTDSVEPISGITCSADGRVFATSDSISMRIYDYQHMALIYHLHSEDYITGFCFSIEGRQFYNLCGSYCNIWQPNVLVRRVENDEPSFDDEVSSLTTLHAASEAWTESPIPVTSMAVSPESMLICTVNDDGDIRLHDINDLSSTQSEAYQTRASIEHLSWTQNGQFFTYFDLSGKIVVHKVEKSETAARKPPSHHSIASVKTGLLPINVHQILPDPSIQHVMVVQHDQAHLWSMESGRIQANCDIEGPSKWAQHPTQPQNLLAFAPSRVTMYDWATLKEIHVWDIDSLCSTSPSLQEMSTTESGPSSVPETVSGQPQEGNILHQALISQDKKYFMLSIDAPDSQQRYSSQLVIIETISLDTSQPTITPIQVPAGIAKLIRKPLGLLKDQLIFLNNSYWVCSVPLSHLDVSSIQQPFFLPKDWVTVKSLELCQIVGEGILLYPKGGEVAIIRSTLGGERSKTFLY